MSTLNVVTIQSQADETPPVFKDAAGSREIVQGAWAWVNFNGTGTVAIRDSFNVTSVTDNTTGDYTVNFTTTLPNSNHGHVSHCGGRDSSFGAYNITTSSAWTSSAANVNIITRNSSFVAADTNNINTIVFCNP